MIDGERNRLLDRVDVEAPNTNHIRSRPRNSSSGRSMRGGGPRLMCSPYFVFGAVILLFIVTLRYWSVSSENAELLDRITKIQSLMKTDKFNMKEMETQLTQTKQGMTKLTEENSRLNQDYDGCKTSLEQERSEMQELSQAKHVVESELIELQGELKTCTDNNSELGYQLRDDQEKLKNQEGQLGQGANVLEEKENEVQAQKEEISRLEEQVRELQGQINELQGLVNTLKSREAEAVRLQGGDGNQAGVMPEGELSDVRSGAVDILQKAVQDDDTEQEPEEIVMPPENKPSQEEVSVNEQGEQGSDEVVPQIHEPDEDNNGADPIAQEIDQGDQEHEEGEDAEEVDHEMLNDNRVDDINLLNSADESVQDENNPVVDEPDQHLAEPDQPDTNEEALNDKAIDDDEEENNSAIVIKPPIEVDSDDEEKENAGDQAQVYADNGDDESKVEGEDDKVDDKVLENIHGGLEAPEEDDEEAHQDGEENADGDNDEEEEDEHKYKREALPGEGDEDVALVNNDDPEEGYVKSRFAVEDDENELNDDTEDDEDEEDEEDEEEDRELEDQNYEEDEEAENDI